MTSLRASTIKTVPPCIHRIEEIFRRRGTRQVDGARIRMIGIAITAFGRQQAVDSQRRKGHATPLVVISSGDEPGLRWTCISPPSQAFPPVPWPSRCFPNPQILSGALPARSTRCNVLSPGCGEQRPEAPGSPTGNDPSRSFPLTAITGLA